MKRISSAKFFAATAVALGAFVAASAAHARTEVHFSIGVPAPVYVEPAPVYVQPAPVYVQPRTVQVQPRPVHVQPDYVPAPRYYGRPHWERRDAYGSRDRDRDDDDEDEDDDDGISNIHDRDGSYRHRRYARRFGPYGDLDRDGIMNMHDRDRDGDGIRNRRDRFPGDPYRS